MKNKAIFVVIFLIAAITAYGSLFSADIVKGKYAGEFIATGVGARALGMGGAFVAIAEDVTAGYWNPAGLMQLDHPQLSGMYAERFARLVNYNYASAAIPTSSKTSLALSVIRLGVDDIPVTDLPRRDLELGAIYDGNKINSPYVVKTINDAEWAFYLSYAKMASRRFSWGTNIKVVTKNVGENSAWGLGFDVGFLYRLMPNLNLGVNLQDITTTLLAWDTGRREAITPTAKTGLAYIWDVPFITGRLIPAFDLDVRFENRRFSAQYNLSRISFDTHFGMEYEFKRLIALRLGSDIGHFAAGAGIKLPKMHIDYAFLSHDDLGDTHRISLILTLQEKKFSRNK